MKKIGFIDYYIHEWHADNYPGWIRKISDENNWDYDVTYAWAETDNQTLKDWCNQYGAEPCDTIEELCEKSDYIVILAPSHPEKHLPYAEIAFKYGKRTYVDKTFAPDVKTARDIYALSSKYKTSFFTTSALRYADEITPYIGVQSACVTGGGSNLEEYIIHQIEMVVKTVGVGAEKVKVYGTKEDVFIDIAYPDGRTAKMNYKDENPFTFRAEGENAVKIIQSDFFNTLIYKILYFFETGSVDFAKEETIEVMKLRESVIKAQNERDVWVNI